MNASSKTKALFNATFGTLALSTLIGALVMLVIAEFTATGQSLAWDNLVPQWSAETREVLFRIIELGIPFVLIYFALSIGAGLGTLRAGQRKRNGGLIAALGSAIGGFILCLALVLFVPGLWGRLIDLVQAENQILAQRLPETIRGLAGFLAIIWAAMPLLLGIIGAYCFVARPSLYLILTLLSPFTPYLPLGIFGIVALPILWILFQLLRGIEFVSNLMGGSGGGGDWGTAEANRISNERHRAEIDKS